MQSPRRLLGCMDTPDESIPAQGETYNPWSIVNLVFRQLAAEGLHPVLGESGDPGKPAAELLRALGIVPAFESTAARGHRRQRRARPPARGLRSGARLRVGSLDRVSG